MTTPSDGPGVVLDVDALRRAADLLRASAPELGRATDEAYRAVADAAASSAPALAAALTEFARRWDEGVTPVAGRVDGYGQLLRATVEAHVADDAAFAAPPR